jgi:hypothetical protein
MHQLPPSYHVLVPLSGSLNECKGKEMSFDEGAVYSPLC